MSYSTAKMRLYFEDECPRIGAGWRTVWVTIGWKWMRFKCAATGRGNRVPRVVGERILMKGENARTT